jgi:hypothetical protein
MPEQHAGGFALDPVESSHTSRRKEKVTNAIQNCPLNIDAPQTSQ